jgi:hypothetical protein
MTSLRVANRRSFRSRRRSRKGSFMSAAFQGTEMKASFSTENDGLPIPRSAEADNSSVLIVTSTPSRFASICAEPDFVATDLEAICAAASRRSVYRAVVAGVTDADGRESGYRLAQLLRTQLHMRCPIYLFSATATPSARAYALQCGATKLLNDDQDLINDLLQLVGDGDAREFV